VAIADMDEARGREAAAELGEAACFVALDVTDEARWIEAIAEAEAAMDGLDVLVNSAGINLTKSVVDLSLEEWRRVHDIDLDGVFLGCKHAIPALRQGGGGSIVNLSSAAALVGTPAFAAYAASKGAVRSLSKTVAVHCTLRGDAIRCNSIHPGGIDTPMLQGLGALAAKAAPLALELLAKQTAARVGKPDDVAELVLYLVSDASSLVTGAEIAIDAGMTAA